MKTSIADHQIISLLLTDREKAFEQLYLKAFPPVARFVSRMGGNTQDAKDIFQDALIILYEKAGEPVAIKSSVPAYVVGIAKHLWNRKYRAAQRAVPLDMLEQDIAIPADFYAPQEPTTSLLSYLEMAGKRCMDILQGFYYDKLSMQQIAQSFGYSSIRSATVQKFKCLEKVRQQVKSLTYESLSE